MLDDLVDVFLEKVAAIEDLKYYDCAMWSRIVSPATFVKFRYEAEFPELKDHAIRKSNDRNDRRYNLTRALEDAYFGGITISLYRGYLDNASWFDIKGAYSKSIQVLNTDQYLAYDWKAAPVKERAAYDRDRPALCQVTSDVVMTSINRSLKIYQVKVPRTLWYWNFDIQAIRLLFPDCTMEIHKVYHPIPLTPCEESIPATWDRLKDEEEALMVKPRCKLLQTAIQHFLWDKSAERPATNRAHKSLYRGHDNRPFTPCAHRDGGRMPAARACMAIFRYR